MRIIIPTKGRPTKQVTTSNLPPSLIPTLVCPESEVQQIKNCYPHVEIVSQSHENFTISEKRKWIVHYFQDEKIVMLDDDLRFAVRRNDDPRAFQTANETEIIEAFKELETLLSPEIPHAGFAVRGMSIGLSAQCGGWQEAKRMVYSLGYHLPTVREHAEFGRVRTREDMDITLQLFAKGLPNLVNFDFVVDQKYANPGGCTDERTVESSNEDARRLVQYHPEFVRLVEKNFKASIPRIEVVCQWQSALFYGKQRMLAKGSGS